MRTNTRRRYAAALLAAAALTLSACSATAEEPAQAADTTASASATPTPAATAEKPQDGPKPVPFDPAVLEGTDGPKHEQITLATDWTDKVASSSYGLSGQYSLDGNDPANIGKLWSNYFSDDLKAKLAAAGVNGDVAGFGSWAIMALAPTESTDPIKASASCTMEFDGCGLVDDTGAPATKVDFDGGFTSDSNTVSYGVNLAVPVSLTEQGNAEGVLKGRLTVNVAFVENPTPGDGRAPYLIDSVTNELADAQADLATKSPELKFAGISF
ncbi:hypothetical protein [Arthrobacter gengyunqii]|uniref:Lipoprotein n=1 Tax=Arthrobacter gengyunqii TaxID=2886940 RepID=A0ABS8GGY2_9MICC|nr:hypothetical protein [Arthrobacter gengyunqii]MCC3265904.1 hypothetical protein [Arthrobacter gengyunqii]